MDTEDARRAAVERVADGETAVETDLGADALAEKVAAVRPRLVDVALAGETTGYAGATDGFALVHGARVRAVLFALGLAEDAVGNPLLPGVVVDPGTDLPDEWFFELLAAADAFDERVPTDEAGRRAVWSGQVLSVWQHAW